MLKDGYHDVPKGKVATVVTQLEMRKRAQTRDVPQPDDWRLTRIQSPTVPWYRALYMSVGADWLWFGRMKLPDADIDKVLSHPGVHIYTLQKDGTDGALLELDFRTNGECEPGLFWSHPRADRHRCWPLSDERRHRRRLVRADRTAPRVHLYSGQPTSTWILPSLGLCADPPENRNCGRSAGHLRL